MLVTDDGISRLANELHPLKALFPMSMSTDDGIVRLANELHPLKARFSMLVTDGGISRLATFVLSTPHSFHELLLMVVTPFGIAKCIFCFNSQKRVHNTCL